MFSDFLGFRNFLKNRFHIDKRKKESEKKIESQLL
jgi:hypothetical protein